MFVRKNRRALKDGSTATYLSLAHNVRERMPSGKSRPKPIILANLGREDDLDETTVKSMRNALDRYIRKRFGDEPKDADTMGRAAEEVRSAAPHLRVLASREFGFGVIARHVWRDLGIDRALHSIDRAHDNAFPFAEIMFAMVLNRLVDPVSKRACNQWVRDDAWLPDLADTDVHHFYRALDLLQAHKDDVLAAIGRAAREGLPDDELATLLLDTTTSYSESSLDDAERAQIADEWAAYDAGDAPKPLVPRPQVVNEPAMRMRGHSKDHRPKDPQVKIGLLRTADGRPVDIQLVAGNVHDQRLTLDLIRAARERLPDIELVVAMDSGMGGTPNLKAIDALSPAVHRVTAVPHRVLKAADDVLLSKPGRWRKHPYKAGFTCRDVLLDAEASPTGRAERWIATRNEREAGMQQRALDKEVSRIQASLARDARVDGHGVSTCKLIANARRRGLIKVNPKGDRYMLDRDRVRIERRRAGVHVIRSTLVEQPVARSLQVYDALYAIESDFRMLKTPLKLRPMHHRASRRIEAHMLMCGLALMLARELERRTGETLETLRRVFGTVRAVEIQQGPTRFWQREEWTEDAQRLLCAVGAPEGPTTWGARRCEA